MKHIKEYTIDDRIRNLEKLFLSLGTASILITIVSLGLLFSYTWLNIIMIFFYVICMGIAAPRIFIIIAFSIDSWNFYRFYTRHAINISFAAKLVFILIATLIAKQVTPYGWDTLAWVLIIAIFVNLTRHILRIMLK